MSDRCERCGVIHLWSVRNGRRKHRCPEEPVPKWRIVAEWARGKVTWFNVKPAEPFSLGQWIEHTTPSRGPFKPIPDTELLGFIYVLGLVWGAVLTLLGVWLFYA